MSIKPDFWIRAMAREHGMIEPFAPELVRTGVISYGVSSYGYDLRLADVFKLFRKEHDGIIDPKKFPADCFEEITAESCVVPPHSYIIGRSFEYFRIPRSILTLCFGKSTYARCGIVINVTPFEPEWEGYATLSIANTSGAPVRLHAGEGVAQLVFLEADTVCETSYADRQGKYQAQKEITLPKM